MPKRVCHISTVHPLLDDRIFYKECVSLAQNGYEVSLVVTHSKEETFKGIKVIPLPEKQGRIYRILIKSFTALKKALKEGADIYHFHDPELIFIGMILKLLGKNVIYDVHEDVPLQILNKNWIGNLFLRRVVSNTFNSIEKFLAKRYSAVISVTEGIVKKFSSNKNAVLLRNFPILFLIDSAKASEITKTKPVMIYAGGLTRIRGIKELVQAVGKFNGEMELWLLGDWENAEFEKECSSLEGFKYTKYLGYIPMDQVYSYMKIADIGMCTLHPTKNHLTSLPVKAFEYMACSLPIVMSDFPFWKKEFEENVIFCNPEDVQDIYKSIVHLLNNKLEVEKFKRTNRELVENLYSWEAESKKLISLYENILKD